MASTTAIPRTHGARAPRTRAKKPAGFHQSWYAIARSGEVGNGEVIGRDFLDGRAIVYRGENGAAVVMNAFCRHLGADLSMGKVIGNDIRCAFHHWQYGPDGGCTKIPASEKIPKAARMFKYPTAEKWGLIWAFNGTSPLFDVPEFVDYAESDLDVRTTPRRSICRSSRGCRSPTRWTFSICASCTGSRSNATPMRSTWATTEFSTTCASRIPILASSISESA